MECKDLLLPRFVLRISGINRNIVECKASLNISGVDFSISINRNIVECKDEPEGLLRIQAQVLIETLWNVKTK